MTAVVRPAIRNLYARAMRSRGFVPDITCYPILKDEWNAYTTIGEIHHTADMTGWLSYGYDKSADSDIDVAWSAGGWHLQGSAHVGNSQSASSTWNRGQNYGHREQSEFHYQKWQWCDGSYQIKSTKWNSGALDGADNSSYDHKCDTTYSAYAVKYAYNTDFDRSSSNYVKFGAAVDVGPISLGAQSGMSTHVRMHIHFGQQQGQIRVICGDNDKPSYSSRVFAGT